MRKTILGIITLLLVLLMVIGCAEAKDDKIVKALDQKTINLVNNTITQYKKDNNWNGKCTIDGEDISVNSIVFGKLGNESAYGTKGAGKKYNNWGNIKYASLKPLPKQNPKKTIKLDGGQYFIYKTPADGIYDLVARNHRRGNNKCNITFASTFMYLKGPNAKKTKDNIADVKMYMDTMKKTAFYFEKNKKLYLVTGKEVDKKSDQINKIYPSKSKIKGKK